MLGRISVCSWRRYAIAATLGGSLLTGAVVFPFGHSRCISESPKVKDVCKDFLMSEDQLLCLMDKLDDQIRLGLDNATRAQSSVKCYNTYVQDMPTGKEKGSFLALDLGGTHFRVLLVKLDDQKFSMESQKYPVPQEIMTGTGEQLFDHIADCLAKFTKMHNLKQSLPLGFTFSFPLEQKGLQKGILQRWTKGFSCSGVVGEDVVALLNKSIKKRKDIKIDVVAILNDTTGTLMSCAWKNPQCRVGVILGTGSNACYVEKAENVIGFDGDKNKPEVLINTEWGAFGDNGEVNFLQTVYDVEVDNNSLNRGKQIFEKMISGMYLGEIVRLVLLKLTQDRILFKGKCSEALMEEGCFETCYISDIEKDEKGCFVNTKKVLSDLDLEFTDEDCANVRYVCECVSRRAAHLASAGVATILNKMGRDSVSVAVDGSLYRFHPHFHRTMLIKILELVQPSIKNVSLMLSEDGSGRGAALVAASATTANSKKK